MTQDIAQTANKPPVERFGRTFLTVISALTFAMLIGVLFIATSYEKGDGLTTYEREAIAVVEMQNDISERWNQTVDTFNASSITSNNDHLIVYSHSQTAVRALIADSQAVINRWQAIDVPDEHTESHELAYEALKATQDGLILFDVFFQDSLDTLVADQIKSGDAAAKLVHAQELWERAAEVAANEG